MANLNQLIAYTKQKLAMDATGHDFSHAQRVARMAQKIMETDALLVDSFVVLAAAYLHDTIDDKVVTDPEQAQAEVRTQLELVGADRIQVVEIMTIITTMSFSYEMARSHPKPLSLAGQIVQDADRLDALGAIGILRTSYFGGGHQHPIFDPEIKPKQFRSKADYRGGSTVINHFYEKLFLLPEKMNTAYGIQEGLRRVEFMESFLTEFYAEWSSEGTLSS